MASPTYNSWNAMRGRCRCLTHPEYARYGGSGLTIDPSWDSYANFHKDMGARPKGHTLDRLDNSKGYFKGNCRWATPAQQALNKGMFSTNSSGVKGVCWKNNRWFASGSENNRQVSLYSGPSFEDAVAARRAWEKTRG